MNFPVVLIIHAGQQNIQFDQMQVTNSANKSMMRQLPLTYAAPWTCLVFNYIWSCVNANLLGNEMATVKHRKAVIAGAGEQTWVTLKWSSRRKAQDTTNSLEFYVSEISFRYQQPWSHGVIYLTRIPIMWDPHHVYWMLIFAKSGTK